LSKVLLNSHIFKCSEEILTIVALLSTPNVFMRPKEAAREADEARNKFAHQDGDHLTMLNAFNAYMQKNGDADWCYKCFLNNRSLKAGLDIKNQLKSIMIK
jgi:pre-mRNA-splicing factor ATP-dependent RNA helicase DHX15/PRP43